MVNTTLATHFDWAPFRRHTVGFDNVFELMDRFLDGQSVNNNYPPYNIYKNGESKYSIELAIAGFGEDEVEVKYADNTLTITGNKEEKGDTENQKKQLTKFGDGEKE